MLKWLYRLFGYRLVKTIHLYANVSDKERVWCGEYLDKQTAIDRANDIAQSYGYYNFDGDIIFNFVHKTKIPKDKIIREIPIKNVYFVSEDEDDENYPESWFDTPDFI